MAAVGGPGQADVIVAVEKDGYDKRNLETVLLENCGYLGRDGRVVLLESSVGALLIAHGRSLLSRWPGAGRRLLARSLLREILALVSGLLFGGGPSAVGRGVVSVDVDAVDGGALWADAHIKNE